MRQLVYDDMLNECVCPEGLMRIVEETFASCVCPSTGLAPGDAGVCEMDAGVDAGFDSGFDSGPGDAGCPETLWYQDLDGDGFGTDAETSSGGCAPPAGFADNANDCNDACTSCNPRGTDVCDLLDNDCDGEVDEALPQTTCYRDADGDGFGWQETTMRACGCFEGWTDRDDLFDCGDSSADAHPGQTEYFDVGYCPGDEDALCLVPFEFFDYDCDGAERVRYGQTVACVIPEPMGPCLGGLAGLRIDCGTEIQRHECVPDGAGMCVLSPLPLLLQACR